MPAPRSIPLSSAGRLRISRPIKQFSHARQWRQSARRGYADTTEKAKEGAEKAKQTAESAKESLQGGAQKVKASELPWMLGAAGVTVVGTYLVVNNGELGPIFKHPLPGDDYHGEGHGEEHEEGEGEEGGEEDGGEEGSSGGDEGGQEEQGEQSSEDGDSDESKSESASTEGTEPEQSSDSDKSEGGENKGVGVGKLSQAKELEQGEKGEKRFVIPSAKGGNMRRIESSKGIVQGRSEETPDSGDSIGDVKDGSKSAVAGQTSKAQKGISNTDTKHSTDQMKNPDQSKKPEGVPETAKIQGTVDPGRRAG